ncbi:MAG: hypothetical protein HC769_25530 [Cyanobacteria bacterium CRU_2_1]|nr:hypothetical protein [Cyanobacteria bacterium RU_5_0]NJR61894.1 hypothetical protein [Cyanobacteria bacterium CRU_2_1]
MAGFSVKFNYGMQWSLSFGLGVFWWFVAISFARFVHPVLQFVLMLVPIAFFVYALAILPKWQKEGQRRDLINSLMERETAHQMMRRHHLNIAGIDYQYEQEVEAMKELVGAIDVPATDEPDIPTRMAHSNLALPEKQNYLLKVQQDVVQACGDLGWLTLEYLSGAGQTLASQEGWISVKALRDRWGRKYFPRTDDLRKMLTALASLQLVEWKDANMNEFRLSAVSEQ